MILAPRWTPEQFTADAAEARAIFRRERLEEPLERWKEAFARYKMKFTRLFEHYGGTDPTSITPEQLATIFKDDLGDELRYLAGPPISADDLKVLAETTLAPGVLARDGDAAQRIIETILQALDSRRFPWIGEHRPPTEAEKVAAIVASAAMLTRQRVQTDRANESKDAQENTVKAFLTSIGFTEVPARQINTLTDAPLSGQFCGEAQVGSRKADVPVRLYDGRLLPIECKVSNSSTNSIKRLNNDAAVKAGIWTREFGTNQIVPAAVLSGVFKVQHLIQAQHGNLTIFWAYNLTELEKFIEGTK